VLLVRHGAADQPPCRISYRRQKQAAKEEERKVERRERRERKGWEL